jgi:polar amino acid transport system substrate-binding protein
MRKTAVFLMFMLVALGSSGLSSQTTESAGGKTLSFVGDIWAPFNMSPGGKPEGYIVDIIRAVFEPQGYEVDYRLVPWAQAIEETKAGEYTAIIGASSADGEGFVFPDEEIAITRLTFVTSATSAWKFTDRASVAKTSLAIIDGYDYRPWLTDYIAEHRGDKSRIQLMAGDSPLESNLRLVASGKVGATVDNETALRYTAKSLGITGRLRFVGSDTDLAQLYVAFSPALAESPELAKAMSDGIRALRASGKLGKILKGYGLSDWK